MHHRKHSSTSKERHDHGPYARLAIMAVLSFLAMYMLMYAMVDRWDNVFSNINQAYMAALMAAPMVLVELVVMAGMYPRRDINIVLMMGAALLAAGCWFGIRSQGGVSDRQFIKSMIPHHAGAVLMCERNTLESADLQTLCAGIISSQNAEIARMKALLQR
jgi:uncharacterized protein (DUF305 family)